MLFSIFNILQIFLPNIRINVSRYRRNIVFGSILQNKRWFTSFINQHGAFLELNDLLTILIFICLQNYMYIILIKGEYPSLQREINTIGLI